MTSRVQIQEISDSAMILTPLIRMIKPYNVHYRRVSSFLCITPNLISKNVNAHRFRFNHGEFNLEEFEKTWINNINKSYDIIELQCVLTNVFGYDVVPTAPIIEAAIKKARLFNDFPTCVRIFVALRSITPKLTHYHEYLEYFKPLMDELGINSPEELVKLI
ncbi:Cytochrome c oxidase, subunit Va/VI domain-containing protein [Rozella allomycis CSF55]|uniref:Cytochrome c oxidase subunit 6, mitochondrial n=1 Tax=Rozella allomycis (strain CSF55) TaxID=988480 RepID=A0A075AX31_ROZAC|nr:Cytochrome c oxidase, subunit Va/VI domain-containing protein [Rozella allomycis CSF55]|eukprot:EPZ34694.1 Cytochrome c oxidase, subunit Va/VI domain-containing protein [Rozella allomycis CSF55]